MSKLKRIRELQNLTQEELSEKSGISARTIQRIESGNEPKGHTLRILAKTLNVKENELQTKTSDIDFGFQERIVETETINYSTIKLINLSSLPFIVIPLFNIIVPVILMLKMKSKNTITKQIISLQIMWTIIAPILFMLIIFAKPGKSFTLPIMIILVLSNVYLIIRNTIEIDKHKTLYYKLKFSII